MDRRKFLTGGALGSATLLAGCDCSQYYKGPAGAASPAATRTRVRELKMVTTWPKNFPGIGTGAEEIARRITVMSGGALNIRVFAAGELVGAFEAFDAVSNGAADLYHAGDYYWIGKSKAYPFFCAVPFGMTAKEIMAWTEYGGGQQLFDELGAKFNIKHFAAGNTGHQLAGWFKKEINSLEDMRGLTIRMPGLGGDVLRRIGANAVNLSGGEIYQALQSGAIDATEWVGPWNDLAFGFYQLAPYYYWPGIHEPGSQLGVGMNLDVWNSLYPAEQEIVHTACQSANTSMFAEYEHANGEALDILVREKGVQLRRMPDDVLQAMAAAAHDVLHETAGADEFTGRVFDSFRKSLAQSQEWSRISDEAYLAVRRKVFKL